MKQLPSGFTLIELAIVLLIVGLLLGGVLATLSTQLEQQRVSETRKALEEIKEALLGYAMANGRLPCPASTTSNGAESFVPITGNATNGNCSNFYDGFVPAVTLGVTPVDDQGYVIDGWRNRIRYAVSEDNTDSHAFTAIDGMRATGMGVLQPDLRVCNTATGITGAAPNTACAAATGITTDAPAVIYSLGKNGAGGGGGTDEAENLDVDRTYVIHALVASGATEFDDIVTWLSANVLYNRMVAAGRLP